MQVSVRVEERGGARYNARQSFELDCEGRLPADAHAQLAQALEGFLMDEWTERILRSF